MIKRGLPAMAAFLGICFSVPAQETVASAAHWTARLSLASSGASESAERYSAADETNSFRLLNSAWYGSERLTLDDGRLFSFLNAPARLPATPADYLPVFYAGELPRVTPVSTLARGANDKSLDLLPKFDYASGEAGVFYGKSTGKYGREIKAGYILGEIVDGNTHITVGVSYQESNGRAGR